MDFKVGDVVQLKSGGPRMTIEAVSENLVDCVWFEKNKIDRNAFNPTLLSKPSSGVALI